MSSSQCLQQVDDYASTYSIISKVIVDTVIIPHDLFVLKDHYYAKALISKGHQIIQLTHYIY